jgi:endonuclease YncB( thermonuclease family)
VWGLFVGSLLAATIAASAQEIDGRATVVDGDTIEIHGERIRLSGIDAPESKQHCEDASGRPSNGVERSRTNANSASAR